MDQEAVLFLPKVTASGLPVCLPKVAQDNIVLECSIHCSPVVNQLAWAYCEVCLLLLPNDDACG
jgi:hypothetical protein